LQFKNNIVNLSSFVKETTLNKLTIHDKFDGILAHTLPNSEKQ